MPVIITGRLLLGNVYIIVYRNKSPIFIGYGFCNAYGNGVGMLCFVGEMVLFLWVRDALCNFCIALCKVCIAGRWPALNFSTGLVCVIIIYIFFIGIGFALFCYCSSLLMCIIIIHTYLVKSQCF